MSKEAKNKNNMSNVVVADDHGYNEMPYPSYPFDYNRPENLKTVATLFGMNPPKLEKARILELGCAEGGNLYRFAADYPNSYNLGVDLSSKQISDGQAKIKDLGLKNIELKHMSITDLDESVGKFDYIICHGVFSWVPDFVREGILEVSKKLLSKDGVAFISYNTLPGWNMIGTVRELMMYHASNFNDINQKVQQAKLSLNFLNESLSEQQSSHAEFMKSSAQMMSDKEDSYIRHEYLAEENKAFYFYEFIDMARNKGLEYLGDADLHRMFVGNLPKKAAETLAQVQDIVRTEQYIDFIKNTQFRCTMLCHNDAKLTRNITLDSLKKLYYSANLVPSVKESPNVLQSKDNVAFYINGNKDTNIASDSSSVKALLYVLSENAGNPLSVKELIELAMKKLPALTQNDFEASLASTFGRLIFAGSVRIMSDKPKSIASISKKPQISNLAIGQINVNHTNGRIWFTNQINQLMLLQDHQKKIISMLDGSNSLDNIKSLTLDLMKNGDIKPMRDQKPITDVKEIQNIANALVDSTLEMLRVNYSLIA